VVGDVIAERYELEELVGSGGMSSVYRADDRLLERRVALKILHERLAADGEHVERFRSEARAVAQLSHPNIVTVIDRGEQDGRQFIVFEYVDGENLKALLDRRGQLPEQEALALVLPVARALAFAHHHGLVHRDVKPQNVLLAEGGEVKVTDFGIARALDVQGGLTQTGTVMGTSDYIAPEQARGEKATAQTDVYSLGIVLYELLVADVPFHGDNFVAVALRHINDPAPAVRERRPDVSPRLDAAIRRATAKSPRDRFTSMDDFAHELQACRDELGGNGAAPGDATLLVPPPPERYVPQRQFVGPLLLVLAGLALLAGLFAVVFALTGTTPRIPGFPKKPAAKVVAVSLRGTTAYDPYGTGGEHDETAKYATDGNAATYWRTEHYNGFALNKPGVGLVLDAGRPRRLSTLVVTTDTPGYTAVIQSGSSPTGRFTNVSAPKVAGGTTTFSINGGKARYYVVWITSLGDNESVHVNEVTARGS
jgi:tRNA A-37 threonylcarbamoyl transferase component Bud32